MGATLAVIAVLLGLLFLLSVPLDIAFRFEGIEAFSGQFRIRWLFGLLRFRLQVPGAGRQPRLETAAQAAERKVKPEKPRRRAGAIAVLRQGSFRRRVYRLVKDMVAAVHLHQVRLRLRLGLGDPAETGRLWALMGPLSAAAANLRGADVQIEPDFMNPVLEFEASGGCRLIPLQVLALAIGFSLSPASIRAWRSLRGSHV